VIQLTAGVLVVDMTAGLPAGDAAVKARANQPKAANREIMRRTGRVVPASREISACAPRSFAAVA
jgi:hypothetical protein